MSESGSRRGPPGPQNGGQSEAAVQLGPASLRTVTARRPRVPPKSIATRQKTTTPVMRNPCIVTICAKLRSIHLRLRTERPPVAVQPDRQRVAAGRRGVVCRRSHVAGVVTLPTPSSRHQPGADSKKPTPSSWRCADAVHEADVGAVVFADAKVHATVHADAVLPTSMPLCLPMPMPLRFHDVRAPPSRPHAPVPPACPRPAPFVCFFFAVSVPCRCLGRHACCACVGRECVRGARARAWCACVGRTRMLGAGA